jgi:hypothetical protein
MRATKDTSTSRKKCRSTRTHTRTLTRKKNKEPHQAKEQFFFYSNKDLGPRQLSTGPELSTNTQTGQLQQKGRIEDLK